MALSMLASSPEVSLNHKSPRLEIPNDSFNCGRTLAGKRLKFDQTRASGAGPGTKLGAAPGPVPKWRAAPDETDNYVFDFAL
jgi:hypothetical protein